MGNANNAIACHVHNLREKIGRLLPEGCFVIRWMQHILRGGLHPFPYGYGGFLFTDLKGYPEVAMHWEHRFKHMINRYNEIYRLQMLRITPHVCRHTYCSNMAKVGMNPKTLQYLMGHSNIGVTLNTYTHLGLEDAEGELKRMEELENARKELCFRRAFFIYVTGNGIENVVV